MELDPWRYNDQTVKLEKMIIVSQKGHGDYSTINAALRKAHKGRTILVRPGVYKEGITITKDINLIADSSKGRVTIEATDTNGIYINSSIKKALVKGFTIRCKSSESHSPLHVRQGQLIVDNCDISSNSGSCVYICGKEANPIIRNCKINGGKSNLVHILDNAKGRIENCDIFGGPEKYPAITIKTGANPVIRNCRIHDNRSYGIWIKDKGRGTIENCNIFGNTKLNICIETFGNPVIRKSKIHDGKKGGIWVNNKGRGTIENCNIYGGGKNYPGINIENGGNPIIKNCNIHDINDSYGIWVHNNGLATIENCDLPSSNGLVVEDRCKVSQKGNREQ